VRRPGALLALALALPAAGCGNGEADRDNAYVARVNEARAAFADTFDRLSTEITSTNTPQQDQRTLRRFRGAVDDAVRRLRAVQPPGAVRALHGRLVRQIDSYGREIEQAREAFHSTSPQRILRAQTDLVSAVTKVSGDINRTIDAINRELRG